MAEHLLSTAVHDTLPGNFFRPESQRPRLAEVVTGARIPVVDLASPDRAAAVAAIGDACRSHGFFQVLNHGIHADLIASVIAVGRDFFGLPAAEKAKLQYSDDPAASKIRLSTSFNVRKETAVHNWRDYLQLHCHPHPHPHPLDEYWSKEVRELGFRLCAEISDSLGLHAAAFMKQTLGLGDQEQHMAYPEPVLTSGGLPAAHTDPDALTIFLMDQDVAGLQVMLHGGKWVAVNPGPGALVVRIGDQQLSTLANRRSRGLSTIDAAVFPRDEHGAPPRLGENRAAAALGQGARVLDPDGIVSVRALLCYSDGLVLPMPLESITAASGETFMRSSPSDAVLVQVRVDDESVVAPIVQGGVTAKATGEDNGRRGIRRENTLGILGIMAASLAVTAAVPAAAGAITPAMAFGYAVLMFTGVSMAMASTRDA